MKKRIAGVLLVALGIAGCSEKKAEKSIDVVKDSVKKADQKVFLTTDLTLNGLSKSVAAAMVNSFRQKPTISKFSSFWFPKSFIQTACYVLAKDGGDGIRIYFAKDGEKDAIVVVYTTSNGQGSYGGSTYDRHKDQLSYSTLINANELKNDIEWRSSKKGLYKLTKPPVGVKDCSLSTSPNVPITDAIQYTSNFIMHKAEEVDTRCVWYSRETMEYLLNSIVSAETGTDNVKIDGVRIYFMKLYNRPDKKMSFLFVTTEQSLLVGHKDNYNCFFGFSKYTTVDHGQECEPFCDTGDTIF